MAGLLGAVAPLMSMAAPLLGGLMGGGGGGGGIGDMLGGLLGGGGGGGGGIGDMLGGLLGGLGGGGGGDAGAGAGLLGGLGGGGGGGGAEGAKDAGKAGLSIGAPPKEEGAEGAEGAAGAMPAGLEELITQIVEKVITQMMGAAGGQDAGAGAAMLQSEPGKGSSGKTGGIPISGTLPPEMEIPSTPLM